MRRHTHLILAEREGIMVLGREGASSSDIARTIGRDKLAVSREFRSYPIIGGPLG